MAIDVDGNIVITGYGFRAFGLPDVLVARYDEDGVLDPGFGATRFTEGGAPVVLDANLSASDVDLEELDTYDGATVTIKRGGTANADDVFSATGDVRLDPSGDLVVVDLGTDYVVGTHTQSAGTLVLTFDDQSLDGDFEFVLRSIAYESTSDAPPAQVQIEWKIEDHSDGDPDQGAGDTITDFTVGAGGDVLDLREILSLITGGNGATAVAGGFLAFALPGADTLLQVDSDGGANSFATLATLTNATLLLIDVANFQLVWREGARLTPAECLCAV